jgi:hypothetical protein
MLRGQHQEDVKMTLGRVGMGARGLVKAVQGFQGGRFGSGDITNNLSVATVMTLKFRYLTCHIEF